MAAAGPADAAKWVGCHLPAGAGIAWLAVNARRLVASEGALTDGPAGDRGAEPFAEEAGQSVIAVPLMGHDQVLGALMVGSDPDRVYSGEEQHLLAVFGDQAALALRNAQLFTETERGRHIAERLAAVARSVPQSLTFTELGRQIADGVVGLLEVPATAVYRLDPETWALVRVAVSAGGGSALHADPVLPRGGRGTGDAITGGQLAARHGVSRSAVYKWHQLGLILSLGTDGTGRNLYHPGQQAPSPGQIRAARRHGAAKCQTPVPSSVPEGRTPPIATPGTGSSTRGAV